MCWFLPHNNSISYNYTYISSLLSFPLLPSSYPSRSSQNARLGSLCYIATSYQLFFLHPWSRIYFKTIFSVCPSFSFLLYRRLYKKGHNNPDNHDGVATYLKPGILECEVKWALGSIAANKASEGDGILAKLFKILKYDTVTVLHLICQHIWKTQH